ncbi:exonuclease domain-containing protein [Alteromonas sp. H39]|uniref:3'-5' exonuclease n=1 Tax=Alteromonas sp. H39 TaxID=3389876 RepID=UPI0039E042FE
MGLRGWWQALWRGGVAPLAPHWQGRKWYDVPLLAVDLELTSLDIAKAEVTSVGWVEGKRAEITMSSCFYEVVKTNKSLEQSPVIHGLTAEDINEGTDVEAVLNALRPFAETHVWVLHNAALDLGVLGKLFERHNMPVTEILTLDTLKLAVYQLKKRHDVLPPNSATLSVCRQRLDLPAAPAHNALDDAVATMQLWFAQFYDMSGDKETKIDDFLHTQAITMKKITKKCKQDVDKTSDTA